MKTAIVYDWMDSWGGVERMLLVLHEAFPHADWYTSFVDPEKANWIPDQIRNDKLKTSFMQKLPLFIKKNRIFSLPFFPFAFEGFNLSLYDLVISVTSSFAKGIITKPHTKHICILLTPTRWLWGGHDAYTGKFSHAKKILSAPLMSSMRTWDYLAAQRPDEIIAISQTVADRCRRYYQRPATVLYPPFHATYWADLVGKHHTHAASYQHGYYLVVSRLVPYKKVDLAIDAFNKMPDKQLVIIGSGPLSTRLRARAGNTIQWYESVSDNELAQWYRHAKGLIVPQEEDFGYVALEAHACGCPVIAFGSGGLTEIVREGKTGRFFHEQTADALREAVEDFERSAYNGSEIETVAKRFSSERFIDGLQTIINTRIHHL